MDTIQSYIVRFVARCTIVFSLLVGSQVIAQTHGFRAGAGLSGQHGWFELAVHIDGGSEWAFSKVLYYGSANWAYFTQATPFSYTAYLYPFGGPTFLQEGWLYKFTRTSDDITSWTTSNSYLFTDVAANTQAGGDLGIVFPNSVSYYNSSGSFTNTTSVSLTLQYSIVDNVSTNGTITESITLEPGASWDHNITTDYEFDLVLDEIVTESKFEDGQFLQLNYTNNVGTYSGLVSSTPDPLPDPFVNINNSTKTSGNLFNNTAGVPPSGGNTTDGSRVTDNTSVTTAINSLDANNSTRNKELKDLLAEIDAKEATRDSAQLASSAALGTAQLDALKAINSTLNNADKASYNTNNIGNLDISGRRNSFSNTANAVIPNYPTATGTEIPSFQLPFGSLGIAGFSDQEFSLDTPLLNSIAGVMRSLILLATNLFFLQRAAKMIYESGI